MPICSAEPTAIENKQINKYNQKLDLKCIKLNYLNLFFHTSRHCDLTFS